MSCSRASRVSLRVATVSCGFLVRAVKTDSIEADDAHTARCVYQYRRTQSARPTGGEEGRRRRVVVLEQALEAATQEVQSDMNPRITLTPSPSQTQRNKEKKLKINCCQIILHLLPPLSPAGFKKTAWLQRYLSCQSVDLFWPSLFSFTHSFPVLHANPSF